ncbi:hypothetical protein X732_30480 [Mesorhizobium sp. L2C066B000]|nr:hypothetical protein X732_30480 [Mesorhizobium sp. L2C066B000]
MQVKRTTVDPAGRWGHAIFVSDVVDTVPIAKLLAADIEGMEVAIMPAHRRLDCLVGGDDATGLGGGSEEQVAKTRAMF